MLRVYTSAPFVRFQDISNFEAFLSKYQYVIGVANVFERVFWTKDLLVAVLKESMRSSPDTELKQLLENVITLVPEDRSIHVLMSYEE